MLAEAEAVQGRKAKGKSLWSRIAATSTPRAEAAEGADSAATASTGFSFGF